MSWPHGAPAFQSLRFREDTFSEQHSIVVTWSLDSAGLVRRMGSLQGVSFASSDMVSLLMHDLRPACELGADNGSPAEAEHAYCRRNHQRFANHADAKCQPPSVPDDGSRKGSGHTQLPCIFTLACLRQCQPRADATDGDGSASTGLGVPAAHSGATGGSGTVGLLPSDAERVHRNPTASSDVEYCNFA